jgi:Caspase domain
VIEDSIRKEIRKFASESNKADVAVVFYAGHGAQLSGSNYLLPIDIDVPHTEADIQFAGLKVDDLINSIGSNTKIVFLDACRDNPALFKNLVKGRGSSPAGLAPASASNFNPTKPGGGIFIAYATDAGAVADDGHGQHSPFTQALLRNMQKPISIDDMFSLVTKEVRLVTKNAQRPFKYASLENIICLTPACSGTPAAVAGDIVQQATQSEDEELQIALQTKNSDALETYLQKYPETKKRSEVLSKIAALKRSELTEWTLYEVGNQTLPQYMQLSSIQQFENRAAARVKWLVNPSLPKVFYNGKELPDAAYVEELTVYDCKPVMAVAESSIFDKSGSLLFHYKWADPQYLNLAIGTTFIPSSIASTARNIVCHEEFATPLISKGQLAEMKFRSLASTVSGDGEIFL